MKIIVETDRVKVEKGDDGVYHVYHDGIVRHTSCTAEDVMRALGHYLFAYEYEMQKCG